MQKKRIAILSLFAIIAMAASAGSAFAWGGMSTNCVAGSYGQAAVGAGATDPLEVIYCNLFNGISGAIGATLALCLVGMGIWVGATGQKGWMGSIPFVLMGVLLGLADSIVGWLGVSTEYVARLLT